MDRLTDPRYVEEENKRILTMATAMYVKSMYPDLTIVEIFEKLQDVDFIKKVINRVVGDITRDLEKLELNKRILVKRWCHACDKVTKWKISPDGKHWEDHVCTECKHCERYKTS